MSETNKDLEIIQQLTDKLIGTMGRVKAKYILQSIIADPTRFKKTSIRDITIAAGIVNCALGLLNGVSENEFYTSLDTKFINGRKCCYYFISKYTNMKDEAISNFFKKKTRSSIITGRKDIVNVIEWPSTDEELHAIHTQMSERVMMFIEKTN